MPDGADQPDAKAPFAARLVGWLDTRAQSAERLTGTPRELLARYLGHFLLAALAGLAFMLLKLPLPWMLGPLTVAFILAVSGRPLVQAPSLAVPLRTILGVAIGSSFTPELLDRAVGLAVSLSMLAPFIAAVTWLGVIFLTRFARFDRVTAFFSVAPGGIADMIIMAHDAGADARRVTLVQAARLLATVTVLPFWLQFVGGLALGGAVPKALHVWQLTLGDLAVICLIAWAGREIAERIGLVGSAVIGPMLLSAAAHVSGLTDAKVPLELLIVAQVSIGMMIGGQFKGLSLNEFFSSLSWGLLWSLILVAAAGGMATIVSRITGIDATALLLSYAPGGQNEMAIMALILGLDAAVIALHHLVRVLMVIAGAQVVFRIGKKAHDKAAAAVAGATTTQQIGHN